MNKDKIIIMCIMGIAVLAVVLFLNWTANDNQEKRETKLNAMKQLCNDNELEFDRFKRICFKEINGFVKTFEIIRLNQSYYIEMEK